MKWYRCEFEVREYTWNGDITESYIITTKDYSDSIENAIEQGVSYLIYERGLEVLGVISVNEI